MNASISHRQRLYGLTADTHFLNLLNQPQPQGTVEQVFNKAINFSIDNVLYTLLCSQLDNAPNSCRLINKDFSLFDIKEGETINLSNKEILIGSHYLISFSLCKEWRQPVINFSDNELKKSNYLLYIEEQISNLDLILTENKNSLFKYQGDNFFYLSMTEQLVQLRSELIESIIKKNKENIIYVIRQFVGLGIGLTPSGDDYLVGLMAFLLLTGHPAATFYPEFYQGITQSLSQTTPISAITLEKALNREYRENMQQLIQSLVDAKET
ncbi:oxamate carbamoyltransferase subunit AllH family protein, partial [Providencia sp. PROV112]